MAHRTMRDSTKAQDIPVLGTQLVAGYVNGLFRWTDADFARFPGIPHVHIDVNGSDPGAAGVLDVETGDATPAQAVVWVAARRKMFAGDVPVIYCNRSTMTPVANAMAAHGLRPGHEFRWWIATLDGVTKTVPDMTGVVAVQWKPAGANSGLRHYDESIVYDDSWHAGAAPPPPVGPTKAQALAAAKVVADYLAAS